MSDTLRAAALLAQVARGLVRHGSEETARTLGDRRTYIGLSDVGRAITCPGFHPLCDWCDHAKDCPKFQADPVSDPVLEAELETFSRLKAEKARIDGEISDYETRIRRFHQRAGTPAGWLSTGRFRFRSARISGRKNIDQTKLRVELTNHLGPDDADALLERVATTGNDYDRLTVSPLT